jgi:hypothetical protein
MTHSLASLVLAAGLIASSAAFAQAPAAAPAGSTGVCKDGSYTSNATKSGACSGHKGVKDWYGQAAAPATTAKAPVAAVPAPAPMAAPAAAAAPAKPIAAPTTAPTPAPSAAPAAGGGAGKVWVNASSKVYHCPGTKYYGKTKQGEYMTEAAAIAAGNHADHGKACAS